MYRGEHFSRENQPSGPSGPLWITQTQKRSSENIKIKKKMHVHTHTFKKNKKNELFLFFAKEICCVGLSLTFLPSIYMYTTLTRELIYT